MDAAMDAMMGDTMNGTGSMTAMMYPSVDCETTLATVCIEYNACQKDFMDMTMGDMHAMNSNMSDWNMTNSNMSGGT